MPTGARRFRFGDFSLDTHTRELRGSDGKTIPLTAKAFDSLCVLIQNRHRVVSQEELLAAVWEGRSVEANNVNQAIAAARRALGTNAADRRYIVTVPGRGYRFVADVQADPEREARPVALAVLPFQSSSMSGPRDELLELGLAETLVTRLGRSRHMRVLSLRSSRRLADDGHDSLSAGRQLGAAYVVEGSTQRVGDNVRVNARLVSVAADETVWADTFDAHIDRAFALQDAIVDAVTAALALQPIASPVPARGSTDADNPQAYRAYLRGYHLLQRPTRANLTEALSAFRHAIDIDTAYARAYAGMALAYRGLVHADSEPREMFPMAKAAVTRALNLEPDSAEALMALGRIQHLYDWDWAAAARSFERAIDLNPSLMEAHFGYAHLLVDVGRFDEGLWHASQARELDPLSPMVNAIEAGFHTAAQQPDAARRRIDRALELQPGFWVALMVRGGMALERGDTASAIADLENAAERSERTSQILGLLAMAYGATGDRARVLSILDELQARATTGYVPATSLAAVHEALGDRASALDLLERACAERDIRLAFLKVDARWNTLRAEPRFQALARQLDLTGDRGYGRF
jgi:DNA-binding winged helix-turn-helix (wHTH) protein/Tfp pilus assembly protein PilF